jgi:iron complex outermembrane receptor protein
MVDTDDKIGVFRFAQGANVTDPYKIRHDDYDEDLSEEGNSQILNINYKSDAFKITSVTGVTYRSLLKYNDLDCSASSSSRMKNRFSYEDRQYTQEIRISSVGKGKLQWLGGLFGSYEETNPELKNSYATQNSLINHHVFEVDTQGYAAFGQATYTIMEKLHFTFGLRLDNQNMESTYSDEARNVSLQGDREFTELLPKFSVSYDISKDAMAYATVARGYLAGGFNWVMTPTQDTFQYDSEYSWNYEIGLKSNWFNNKVAANLSFFYITINDKQVSTVDPDTNLNTITNAAEAYSYGCEIQLKAKPIAGLELFANLGYNQAKFDKFDYTGWNSTYTAVVSQDMSGNYLPYAPEYTYNAGAQYRMANGLMGRVDVFGTGNFYGDPANLSEQEAYQLVNLRLGYEGEHWEAYLWAKNLFDQDYLTWLNLKKSNLYAVDGPPRTFGVTVAYRF